jgi:hypothetical protein
VRLRLLTAAALLAALVIGGCGDDGPKIKTKADFITAADSICVERDAASTKLQTSLSNDYDLAKLTGSLADIYVKAVRDITAIPLPPGAARAGAAKYIQQTAALRKPVARMKSTAVDLTAAEKTRKTAIIKNAGQQLQISVSTVQALGDVADATARAYGMHNCGQAANSNPVS